MQLSLRAARLRQRNGAKYMSHSVKRMTSSPKLQTRMGFVHPSDAGQQHHHPSLVLLEAIYSEKSRRLCFSIRLCQLARQRSRWFPSRVFVPAWDQTPFPKFCSVCWALLLFSESWLVGDQCFGAVALSLFWCCLTLQILTSWVFIVLCGSLDYCFPR